MWRENQIPLVAFYEACKQNLKKADYKLLLCLICRKADAPEIFEEIREHWSSFHDVTRNGILFMFAGDNLHLFDHNSHILVDNIALEKKPHDHPMSEIIYSDSAIISGDYTTPIGRIDGMLISNIKRGHPRIRHDQDFEQSHSLEISNLSKHLGIVESDVPCLNITYLPCQFSCNFKFDIRAKFYPFIKFLSSEFYKSDLSKVSKVEINESKQYELHINQLKTNLRNKIIKIQQGGDNGFQGNFLRWSDALLEKEAFRTNVIIRQAVEVISNYINLPKETVLKAVERLKNELPTDSRYQRMIGFSQKYFQKYYGRPVSDTKLSELQYKLKELEQIPLSNIYLARFNDFIQNLSNWNHAANGEVIKFERIRNALNKGDVTDFINVLRSLFAGISYNIKLTEGYFHAHIQSILDLSGIRVTSEKETNVGRIDAVAETDNFVYIMEFKLDNAEAAIAQIKSRRYYEAYLSSDKEIVLLGIAFNTDIKNISNFVIDKVEKKR